MLLSRQELTEIIRKEIETLPFPVLKEKYLQMGYSESVLNAICKEIYFGKGFQKPTTIYTPFYERNLENSKYYKYYNMIVDFFNQGHSIDEADKAFIAVPRAYILQVAHKIGMNTSGTNVARNTYKNYREDIVQDSLNGMNITQLYEKYSHIGISPSGIKKIIENHGGEFVRQRNHHLDVKEKILERIRNGETPEAVYEDFKDSGISLKRIKVWCRDILGLYVTGNIRAVKPNIIADIKSGMNIREVINKYPQVAERTIYGYKVKIERGEL